MPEIVQGLSNDFRKDAIDIVLGSLGDKIIPAMGGRRKAEILFEQTMDPSCALVAVESGRLTGLIAVKSSEIAFVDAGLWDFVRITGFFRSFWSVPILGLLEHNPGPDELYLDMIVVHPDARGKGVGRTMMAKAEEWAGRLGKTSLSLQVVDTNIRARSLYEREGFQVRKEYNLYPLGRLVGWTFRKAFYMEKNLKT